MTPEIPIDSFEIYASGLDHPECLAFDSLGQLWAGGEAGQIYRIGENREAKTVTNLGGFCAGLAFSPEDELFVCCPVKGIVAVRSSGTSRVFATRAGGHPLVCPNYGVFDSDGNYYLTDSGHWKKHNGALLRFRPNGEGEILAKPLGYANGLALSADGRFLFMVESDTDSVFRFPIQSGGAVGAAELYADGCGRFPDGLALDAEGNLYVFCYASDEIWRIDPRRQKTLFAWDRFAILLGSPTNMAFGGSEFDEMFVANLARTTITRAKAGRKGQPLANQRELHVHQP